MLAIAGGKGGCGKTTTTLGLARALPGPVLAADCDRDLPNLLALAGVDRARPGDPVPDPEASGVSLLGPDQLERNRPLADLKVRAASVLLDCPAGAGPDAVEPLQAADAALVVSSLCAPSLRDAAKTAAMARALGTPVVGAVLTRARLSPSAVTDLLGCPVLTTVPTGPAPVLAANGVRAAYARLACVLRGEDVL